MKKQRKREVKRDLGLEKRKEVMLEETEVVVN